VFCLVLQWPETKGFVEGDKQVYIFAQEWRIQEFEGQTGIKDLLEIRVETTKRGRYSLVACRVAPADSSNDLCGRR
jgi:hypothetical protein